MNLNKIIPPQEAQILRFELFKTITPMEHIKRLTKHKTFAGQKERENKHLKTKEK